MFLDRTIDNIIDELDNGWRNYNNCIDGLAGLLDEASDKLSDEEYQAFKKILIDRILEDA